MGVGSVLIFWPLTLLTVYLAKMVVANISIVKNRVRQRRARGEKLIKRKDDSLCRRLIMKNLDFVPVVAFSVVTYVYYYYNTNTSKSLCDLYPQYAFLCTFCHLRYGRGSLPRRCIEFRHTSLSTSNVYIITL